MPSSAPASLQHDARAHFRGSLERPALAAAVKIEGVDGAVLAADEDGAHGDGGLRARPERVGVGESPLEFQVRHVPGAESRRLGIDEAPRVVAPADLRHGVGTVEFGRGARAGRRMGPRDDGIEPRAGDVFRNVGSLLVGEMGGLGLHDPVRHGRMAWTDWGVQRISMGTRLPRAPEEVQRWRPGSRRLHDKGAAQCSAYNAAPGIASRGPRSSLVAWNWIGGVPSVVGPSESVAGSPVRAVRWLTGFNGGVGCFGRGTATARAKHCNSRARGARGEA